MPVRMLNFLTHPPPRKALNHAMKNTEEWQDFCIALGAGLKPQEYICIELPSGATKVKFPNASFVHAARKKIKELGVPYDCYERGGVIYVVGRGVIS